MAYQRVYWNNGEAGGTPLNATNLNAMDLGIDELETNKVPTARTIANIPLSSNISASQLKNGLGYAISTVETEAPEEGSPYTDGDFYYYNNTLYIYDNSKPSGSKWVEIETGGSYTAGDGIDIINSTISVDDTISRKPEQVSFYTSATSWTSSDGVFSQQISIIYDTTSNTSVDIRPTANNLKQLMTDGVSALWVENNNGTLTAKCLGNKPSVNMTFYAIASEVAE